MLRLDAVDKTYPNGVHALEKFSADINVGEIVAIIGGSGCGKSTLLRAVSGLDPATSGRVTLDGVTITAPHAKIGIIFQEPRLLPWLSVADNIGFGLGDVSRGVRRTRIAHALAKVGLADKANAWPRELSGGQAQRVAIARALVPQPEVLLLDEPFSALDAFTRRDLQDHLLDLWAESSAHFPKFAKTRGNTSTRTSEKHGHYQKSDAGAASRSEVPETGSQRAPQGLQIGGTRPTLVLVTHDVEEAVVLADRVFVMRPRPGRLFEEIQISLGRPRDRNSPSFDNFKRRVLTALDRSLDRTVRDTDAKSNTGEALWW